MDETRNPRRFTRYAIYLALLILLLLAPRYCTYVPFETDRAESKASDKPNDGALQKAADRLFATSGENSTFFPLISGNDALGARLKLIAAAEKSLDLQYFLMKPDRAGAVISAALIEAAERGVQIRFLLDDIFTTVSDRQLAALDSHENIEVRLFNPLSRRSIKAVNFAFDFRRVNRRMHNKSFTADGTVSIIGGRNIAEEYFQIETDAEFADYDMLCFGPIVKQIEDEFDLYWNDAFTVSMNLIHADMEKSELTNLLKKVDENAARALTNVYQNAVSSDYLTDIVEGRVTPNSTKATLVTDTPDKLRVPVYKGASQRILFDQMTDYIQNAETEVTIITPYFVPEPWEIEMYQELAQNGVRVRIITNSLAATNHSYVHGGYAPSRKPLLHAGVEIYEVRADAPEILGSVPAGSSVKLTMHTKAAVFDRKTIFVGSMNFDPRSIAINTEVGAFLFQADFGEDVLEAMEEDLQKYTYRVGLTDGGDLVWHYEGSSGKETFHSEPGASMIDKIVATVARYVPFAKSQM